MTDNKPTILFIPADNIKANISRSYFFAKGLAKHTELYFLTWEDHRTAQWLGNKPSKINTITCFIKSFFNKTIVYQNTDENFSRIKCSIFIDALIGRILGKISTKKLMRKHNLKSLQKLVDKLKPDVIFYADASYFFPVIDDLKSLKICDIQDDIDWESFPKNLQLYEKDYRKNQYQKFDIRYIVSENANKNISKNFGNIPFKVMYNGADFSELQKDFLEKINTLKNKHHLQGKYILTHIGSPTWVDPVFTKKLLSEIYTVDQSIVLILVGSMEKIELPNIINIGMVSALESYAYYNLTDLGILLKDSKGSNFLYNSVPLKNIQYGAVKKPVISFPIQWLEENNFNNTHIINNVDIDKWIDKIQEVRTNFNWTEADTNQWENYNWETICSQILNDINKYKTAN